MIILKTNEKVLNKVVAKRSIISKITSRQRIMRLDMYLEETILKN